MKTIESLKEEKTFYRRERNFEGDVIRTPYKSMVPVKINMVSQGV